MAHRGELRRARAARVAGSKAGAARSELGVEQVADVVVDPDCAGWMWQQGVAGGRHGLAPAAGVAGGRRGLAPGQMRWGCTMGIFGLGANKVGRWGGAAAA